MKHERREWTHAVCDACWVKQNPNRSPIRTLIAGAVDGVDGAVDVGEPIASDACCFCGEPSSGIYVRRDPASSELHCGEGS